MASIVQMKQLCNQLEILQVNYSISSFTELLEDTLHHFEDEDVETPMEGKPNRFGEPVWQRLRELDCSHNTITKLDASLRFNFASNL